MAANGHRAKDGREVQIEYNSVVLGVQTATVVYLERKDAWVSPDSGYGYDPLRWRPKPTIRSLAEIQSAWTTEATIILSRYHDEPMRSFNEVIGLGQRLLLESNLSGVREGVSNL